MPHIHEKIDFTVEVFVVHNNKVLLRKHDKYLLWLSVGGHIELDEDPNEAALREVSEEVGLNVQLHDSDLVKVPRTEQFKEIITPQFMNRHRINATHEHVTHVYFARATTDILILKERGGIDVCKWFTREEIDDPQYNLAPHIKKYAVAALETLGTTNH